MPENELRASTELKGTVWTKNLTKFKQYPFELNSKTRELSRFKKGKYRILDLGRDKQRKTFKCERFEGKRNKIVHLPIGKVLRWMIKDPSAFKDSDSTNEDGSGEEPTQTTNEDGGSEEPTQTETTTNEDGGSEEPTQTETTNNKDGDSEEPTQTETTTNKDGDSEEPTNAD